MLGKKYKIPYPDLAAGVFRTNSVHSTVKSVLTYFGKFMKVCWEEWHQQEQGQSQLQAFPIYTVSLTRDFRSPPWRAQLQRLHQPRGVHRLSGVSGIVAIGYITRRSVEAPQIQIPPKKRLKHTECFYAQVSHPDTQSRCGHGTWKHCSFGSMHGMDRGSVYSFPCPPNTFNIKASSWGCIRY